jgi:hypothetical protein
MFCRFGVSPDLLDQAGVFRMTDAEARAYGFSLSGPPTANLSGLVFPYFDPSTRRRVTARLRRDHPEVDTEGRPKNKYLSPYGDNRHLYFPPNAGALLTDAMVFVAIVESENQPSR